MKETMVIEGVVKAHLKNGKGFQLDNGYWFSQFHALNEKLPQKGDKVKVEYVINGDFKNIVTLEIIGKSNKPQTTETVSPTLPSQSSDREKLIIRQSSIKAAAIFLQNKDAMTVNDLTDLAELIEEWVWRQNETSTL